MNTKINVTVDVTAPRGIVLRYADPTDFPYPRWLRVLAERHREEMLEQSLNRMKGFAESAARHMDRGLNPGDKVALLNVYTNGKVRF